LPHKRLYGDILPVPNIATSSIAAYLGEGALLIEAGALAPSSQSD
jgi:hypothetical protein